MYTICGITRRFHRLSLSYGQVTHALLARPPLSILNFIPKKSVQNFSFDLHVLGTPPAFVLSQDQTLVRFVISHSSECYIRSFFSLTFVCFLFFPNFLFVKNSQSNCSCIFSIHFQELTLFIFQCTSLSHRQLH